MCACDVCLHVYMCFCMCLCVGVGKCVCVGVCVCVCVCVCNRTVSPSPPGAEMGSYSRWEGTILKTAIVAKSFYCKKVKMLKSLCPGQVGGTHTHTRIHIHIHTHTHTYKHAVSTYHVYRIVQFCVLSLYTLKDV